MTTISTTISKQDLMRLLAARIREMNDQYEADVAAWEARQVGVATRQAEWLRKMADRIEAGKAAPANGSFSLPYGKRNDGLHPGSRPQRPYCRAKTMLDQVRNSSQDSWRMSTNTYEAIFGKADCAL